MNCCLYITGARGRGGDKKSLEECVKLDLKLSGLIKEAALIEMRGAV